MPMRYLFVMQHGRMSTNDNDSNAAVVSVSSTMSSFEESDSSSSVVYVSTVAPTTSSDQSSVTTTGDTPIAAGSKNRLDLLLDAAAFIGDKVVPVDDDLMQMTNRDAGAGADVEVFSCVLCSPMVTFPDIASWLRHDRLMHAEDRLYSCSTCQLRFAREVMLKQHIKRDHGRPRQQETSERTSSSSSSSSSSSNLATTGTAAHHRRPHACSICSKRFVYRRTLSRHLAEKHGATRRRADGTQHRQGRSPAVSHSGSFQCTLCSGRFPSKRLLVGHCRVYHADVLLCPFCPEVFITTDQVRNHCDFAHVLESTSSSTLSSGSQSEDYSPTNSPIVLAADDDNNDENNKAIDLTFSTTSSPTQRTDANVPVEFDNDF